MNVTEKPTGKAVIIVLTMQQTVYKKNETGSIRTESVVSSESSYPSCQYHTPVLLEETMEALAIKPNGVYVDCTVGGGGHFQEIINRLQAGGMAIGIDRDSDAIQWCEQHIARKGKRVVIQRERFSNIREALQKLGIDAVDGILADLGLSTHQIRSNDRGFSYMENVRLDMRMDQSDTITAAEILRTADKQSLIKILSDFGEIRNPGRMAETIIRCRETGTLTATEELKQCLRCEYGERLNIKMLAKLFQALRIAVNGELQELRGFCDRATDALRPGGRLVIISYHSLEDRFVKNYLRDAEKGCTCAPTLTICVCGKKQSLKRISVKAIIASQREVGRNAASRSARLRVAEKVTDVTDNTY